MKPKVLYLLLAAFLIIIFISVLINIWLNNMSLKIKADEKQTASQQLKIESPAMLEEQAAQSLPAAVSKSAIIIIRPPAKEKAVSEDKIKEEQQQVNTPSSATEGSPVSQGYGNDFSEEPSSGIIKADRMRPSEVESKEMNERGIMIW